MHKREREDRQRTEGQTDKEGTDRDRGTQNDQGTQTDRGTEELVDDYRQIISVCLGVDCDRLFSESLTV